MGRMLQGVNHVTTVTKDMDRLVQFYERVFDATKLVEIPIPRPEGGRHCLIDLGQGMTLHAFEMPGTPEPNRDQPMFSRGAIDHFALQVQDADAFEELRHRLIDCGASDGVVTDFGVMSNVGFRDPDGLWCEIARWYQSMDPSDIDMAMATDANLGTAGGGQGSIN